MRSQSIRQAALPALKLSALAVGLALAGSANAVQFKYENGLTGSIDTTISAGISVRTQAADPSLIGIANGGTSRSVNEDDGDRNYGKNKPFSELLKVTHDVEMKFDGWSFFGRGLYFMDFKTRKNSSLGPVGRERIGQDAKILDAFVSKGFDVFGKNVKLRAGNQVISWGESTFIPNGINIINPVDISKLRVPGSELKEAFIPATSALISLELTKNASLEGWMQFNFEKIKLDPKGSYWSNNDFASDDATQVFVGFGRRRDLTGRAATNPAFFTPAQLAGSATLAGLNGLITSVLGPSDPAAAVWAPRGADRNPSDWGQYGLAFRYLATDLNNTEFGAYYMNYHSRIPFFSGIKGKVTSALTGANATITANVCSAAFQAAAGTALCDQARTDLKASYFAEYPENIRLIGLSFNTQGPAGIALQGEISYRPNQPIQNATPELLLAALGAPNVFTGQTQIPGAPVGATSAAFVPDGAYQQGWSRVKMTQAQITGTKAVPNIFGADQGVLVGEVGVTRYHGLDPNLRYNGPAVYLPATELAAALASTAAFARQTEGFLEANSWGYRLVGRLDYSNLMFGANVSPRFAFNHDVKGTSQTFNEGVKSFSLGAAFDWQKKIVLDVSYNNFFGGKKFSGCDTAVSGQVAFSGQSQCYESSANPVKDRDFISLSLSYSF
jgi:Protein of unknown function (DUF1302)